MNESEVRYDIRVSFKTVKLPPFNDILVLGRRSSHGRNGINKVLQLLAPDGFEAIDVADENISTIFVSTALLAKVDADKIVHTLRKRVFPYVTSTEVVKVDFHVDVSLNAIEFES